MLLIIGKTTLLVKISVAHFFSCNFLNINLWNVSRGYSHSVFFAFFVYMKQIQTPVIVTFANQKGGVGKTTLCICFANYLVSKGVKVRILDCDRQQSVARTRKRDLRRYGDSRIPYEIEGFRLLDRDKMLGIISDLYKHPENEVVLIDCPGNMSDGWLIPLIGNSDIVVIPYHYDDVTITSTSEFILFVDRINQSAKKTNPTRLFMIPNISDKRFGTREELQRWDETREGYAVYGTVTPKVSRLADMQRISTVSDLEMQLDAVSPALSKIYYDIFGCLDPIRTPMKTLHVRTEAKVKNKNASVESEEVDAMSTDSSEDSINI